MLNISPENLSTLTSKKVVVDVRDDDWEEVQCIPGSINLKSSLLTEEVLEEFINKEHSTNGTTDFIFHCMYSQVRGPKAARMAISIRDRLDIPIEIYVLKDGIIGWRKWNDDQI